MNLSGIDANAILVISKKLKSVVRHLKSIFGMITRPSVS